jgi:ABC-type antimicrobial peptide transport system permease subunit
MPQHTVSLHSREIGIRLALGASATSVQLKSQLFVISPRDPVTYAITPVGLLAVAMLAVFVPARRATWVDPAIVLRSE